MHFRYKRSSPLGSINANKTHCCGKSTSLKSYITANSRQVIDRLAQITTASSRHCSLNTCRIHNYPPYLATLKKEVDLY